MDKIIDPYMNDYCDKCEYKSETDTCIKLGRPHCGSVRECGGFVLEMGLFLEESKNNRGL